MLVDEQDVGVGHEVGRQRGNERGIVEQHRDAVLVADARGFAHGAHRAFQAQAQHGGAQQVVGHGTDVPGVDGRVGTRRIDDGVLAMGVDRDHGGAARAGHATDGAGAHARVGELAEQELRVGVAAQGAEQADGRAQTRGGRGLVAGLSARQNVHRTALDRFSRLREPLGRDRVVGVHRADHAHLAAVADLCEMCLQQRFRTHRPSLSFDSPDAVCRPDAARHR